MKYCKIASDLLKAKIVCGKECPIYKDCPQLIMEDAMDKAIIKAMKAMLRSYNDRKNGTN